MGLILDTSALIALERFRAEPDRVTLDSNEIYVLPAIVWAEALVGVRMAADSSKAARRLARLEAIRRVTGVEDFSDVVAEHYADIFSELSRSGILIPQNDIAVAATARRLDFGVLVGPQDEAHFRRVPNLDVQVL
ncbi:MAG: PIN domain-containing protein [Verrucomicrobia bacterium]|jgi:predicted nucleic acid-binding protein|nr:PIN domain-containing protein [Verrucomicrobiota bacterium]